EWVSPDINYTGLFQEGLPLTDSIVFKGRKYDVSQFDACKKRPQYSNLRDIYDYMLRILVEANRRIEDRLAEQSREISRLRTLIALSGSDDLSAESDPRT